MLSSKDKIEVSLVKCHLAALEKTIQEIYAKQGIDQETMDEENTTPTVDQHNSFKASCTLNEKEFGVSDQQPTPNVNKECQIFLDDSINGGDVLVAIGGAYMECVPTDIIHGIPLGEENVQVAIIVPGTKTSTPTDSNKRSNNYGRSCRWVCCLAEKINHH
ncbi:hypothetical protein TIFTF001_033960 [Ficus carica]|uniref:Uncharacterized protein n=1 Tax=Ficus carica TaxID=3494 RepID=A0AA88E2X5_FICCA|nr:hypothetical protein TIFTF001_033960 [Ficus carica]